MTVHIRHPQPPAGRRVGDRGSATVEMLAALPLLLTVLCFLVFCGRVGVAHLDVAAAASAAARAASQQRTPAAATAAAQASAAQALAGKNITCAQLTVSVDTSGFGPGGQVTVSVACQLTTADLIGLGTADLVVVNASATSPVDTFRARGLGFGITEAPSVANPSTGGA